MRPGAARAGAIPSSSRGEGGIRPHGTNAGVTPSPPWGEGWGEGRAATELDHRFKQRVVSLSRGTHQAIREAGTGAPIVLLHGIGSGAASWLPCAMALESHSRVIAWDAPGYGASTPLSQTTPLATDYAQRLGDLLTALNIDRCTIVGHSLGALMAAAFAHGTGGARVQRLVLLSPARGYGAPGHEAARRATLTQRLDDLRTLGVAGLAARSAERMLTPAASDAARAWVRWNTARLNPAGYSQALQMLCADDIARYAPLAIPVEVHCGDGDTVTPPQACRDVAATFAAPFTLIDHAGHACAIEQPGAVAALIARAADLP